MILCARNKNATKANFLSFLRSFFSTLMRDTKVEALESTVIMILTQIAGTRLPATRMEMADAYRWTAMKITAPTGL